MCLDIAYYSALELIDGHFPDLLNDRRILFDPEQYIHVMAMAHLPYPVILFEDGKYRCRYFEWGIIAEYMDTPEKVRTLRKNMVNARSEKVLDDRQSFWYRIRHKRCLIPVTGIYEHREVKGWKQKVPYHIRIKDRPFFCLPGLYHYNEKFPSDPETGEVRGMFTLLTRNANSLMKQIHNSGTNAFRMPVFLPPGLELEWLQPDLTDEDIHSLLAYEMPSDRLAYWPVFSIRGKTIRPDGKLKNEPYAFENLPPLGNNEGNSHKQMELF